MMMSIKVRLLLLGFAFCQMSGGVTLAGEETTAAVEEVKTAVELFVNARTAGSADDFMVAVAKVKALADAGQPFFRFLLAVYAGQEPLCGLSEETGARYYLREGRPMMRKYAGEGNALAQYLVGLDCAFNLGQAEEARDWLERAAAQGHALAQNNLGLKYYLGQGVPQDNDKAGEYFRQAALQADMNGEYNLGTMYVRGHGVPKDEEMAFQLYTRAAEKGHSNAMNNLGWLYQEGRGVVKSPEKAADWYRKSAESGNADGQFNFGFICAHGIGIPQDFRAAGV